MSKRQSDRDAFKELCVGYVLNILEQGERERFEVMLDDATDEQRALYERMRTRANELMFGDTEKPDPEELKEQLLAEVDADENDKPTAIAADDDTDHIDEIPDDGEPTEEGSRISYAVVFSIALGLICLSLIFYSFSMWSSMNAQEDEIAEQDERIEELNADLDELESMLSVLESRQLHVVPLLGMEANPFGYGNALWDSQNLRVLVKVGDLSTPESEMEYQLWAISDNEATPLHQFSVNSDGEARFFVEGVDALKNKSEFSFAVTLEPEGGSDKPDGEMYLMGSFEE